MEAWCGELVVFNWTGVLGGEFTKKDHYSLTVLSPDRENHVVYPAYSIQQQPGVFQRAVAGGWVPQPESVSQVNTRSIDHRACSRGKSKERRRVYL